MLAVVTLCGFSGALLGQSSDFDVASKDGVAAQAIDPAPWADFKIFDTGYDSSVAIHSSGLIVEVHASGLTYLTYTGLYYHVGKLDPTTGTVSWGPSHRFVSGNTNGAWPAVAITKEGYVIITYSNAFFKSDGRLRYYVGTLDLGGGTSQTINFKSSNIFYDTGFHNSISVNYNGTIAEAHEGDGSNGLFYRLGHLRAPGSGDFSIVWDTGTGGTRYDGGINPHISINDNGDVVEVHQVASRDYKLHYIRGRLGSNTITFGSDKPRYENNGRLPIVALLNNGYVMEIHVGTSYNTDYPPLMYRVGTLDPNVTSRINWGADKTVGYAEESGGLGTNENYAVTTPGRGIHLYSSWAITP